MFLHDYRFFDNNNKKMLQKKPRRYSKEYRRIYIFNKIDIFVFLVSAFHKEPIGLYDFALYILGVLNPPFIFKSNKL